MAEIIRIIRPFYSVSSCQQAKMKRRQGILLPCRLSVKKMDLEDRWLFGDLSNDFLCRKNVPLYFLLFAQIQSSYQFPQR